MTIISIPLQTLVKELEAVRNRLKEGFWKPTFALVSISGFSFLSDKPTPSWEISTYYITDDEYGGERIQDAKESNKGVVVIRRSNIDEEIEEMARQMVEQMVSMMQSGEII